MVGGGWHALCFSYKETSRRRDASRLGGPREARRGGHNVVPAPARRPRTAPRKSRTTDQAAREGPQMDATAPIETIAGVPGGPERGKRRVAQECPQNSSRRTDWLRRHPRGHLETKPQLARARGSGRQAGPTWFKLSQAQMVYQGSHRGDGETDADAQGGAAR